MHADKTNAALPLLVLFVAKCCDLCYFVGNDNILQFIYELHLLKLFSMQINATKLSPACLIAELFTFCFISCSTRGAE